MKPKWEKLFILSFVACSKNWYYWQYLNVLEAQDDR